MSRPVVKHAGPGTRKDLTVCMYCRSKVGEEHGPECVVVCHKVRLEYTFTVEVMAPSHWTPHDIEFHRNDGSWCADIAVAELESLTARAPTESDPAGHDCLCGRFKCRYVETVDPAPVESDG